MRIQKILWIKTSFADHPPPAHLWSTVYTDRISLNFARNHISSGFFLTLIWFSLASVCLVALTSWVISHLLRILAVPGFNLVQATAYTVFLSILQLAKGHNPYVFCRLTSELIDCMSGKLAPFFYISCYTLLLAANYWFVQYSFIWLIHLCSVK